MGKPLKHQQYFNFSVMSLIDYKVSFLIQKEIGCKEECIDGIVRDKVHRAVHINNITSVVDMYVIVDDSYNVHLVLPENIKCLLRKPEPVLPTFEHDEPVIISKDKSHRSPCLTEGHKMYKVTEHDNGRSLLGYHRCSICNAEVSFQYDYAP